MAHERAVDRAIANIEKELARPVQYVDREWFARVRSADSGATIERDWSGANWAGRSTGGGNWAGGRER